MIGAGFCRLSVLTLGVEVSSCEGKEGGRNDCDIMC